MVPHSIVRHSMVAPADSKASSLLTGTGLLWLALLVANLAFYFLLFPSSVPVSSRGRPLSDCLEPYTASASAVSSLRAHFSNATVVSALREAYRDKWVYFIGDSTLRESYYELGSLLRREGVQQPVAAKDVARRLATKHDQQESRIGSSKLSYAWRPTLRNATAEYQTLIQREFKPDLIVFSVGLHDLLYNSDGTAADLKAFTAALASTHGTPDAEHVPSILFRSSPHILDDALAGHRKDNINFRTQNVKKLNEQIRKSLTDSLHHPWRFAWVDGWALTHDQHDAQLNEDGLHSQQAAAVSALALAGLSGCHFGTPPFELTPGQLSLLLFFLALLFAFMYAAVASRLGSYRPSSSTSNGVVYSALPASETANALETGSDTVLADKKDHSHTATASASPSLTPATPGSSSSASVSQFFGYFSKDTSSLLFALLQLSFILLFLFLMDGDNRLSWQLIGDKLYIRDTFAFVCILLALLAYPTLTPTHEKGTGSILNRDQTEEWKGWMQILFVLYHYFAAKELYNLIRVFIAAYVFLTGYGNFFFFQKYADYSFVRLSKMLFRLNFFVLFVCVAMNREYMQYYVCALHTTFFMFVYVFMGVWQSRNKDTLMLTIKFVVAFVLLYLIWDYPQSGLFNVLFSHFSLFYWKGSLHEWLFRSTLDHYVTIIGMLVACNIHHLTNFYTYIDKQGKSAQRLIYAAAVAMAAVVFYLWYAYCLTLPKSAYNRYNPYTTFVPILAFIFLRNLTPWLRTHNLFLFTWCGRITLETYILQFHVWLADDAATLVFYTGSYQWPMVNFVIASTIYIGLAYLVFHLTTSVSDALIPKNATTWSTVQRLVSVAAVWGTVYHASKLYLVWRAG